MNGEAGRESQAGGCLGGEIFGPEHASLPRMTRGLPFTPCSLLTALIDITSSGTESIGWSVKSCSHPLTQSVLLW